MKGGTKESKNTWKHGVEIAPPCGDISLRDLSWKTLRLMSEVLFVYVVDQWLGKWPWIWGV